MSETEVNELAARLAEKMGNRIAPRLMDIEMTANYLGRTATAVQMMMKRGKLPVVKLDGKIQVDRVALDRLIAKNTESVA